MMDPNTTLDRLRKAYGTNDWHEQMAAADDLLTWIREGGFPSVVTEPQLSALLIIAHNYARFNIAKQASQVTV